MPGRRRGARVARGLVIAAVMLGATAPLAQARPEIGTDPKLTPSFDPGIHDYTVRCDGDPVQVTAEGGPETKVKLSGRRGASRTIAESVELDASQSFTVAFARGERARRYHVRCLPTDFAEWTFERLLRPSHRFYATTVNRIPQGSFAVVFDGHGAPVWWQRTPEDVFDAKVLGNGRIAYGVVEGGDRVGILDSEGYSIQDLDGRRRRIVGVVGSSTDVHDLQRLPNGDFLVFSYKPREDVDLTAYGGGADETVLDALIQQVDRQGKVVWSWNSKDHVDLEETGRWWDTHDLETAPRDLVHINSVEPAGSRGVLISLRHTDAVYRIDKPTGEVVWKLGGTTTPESLDVANDAHGEYPFGGQHDARLLANGTVTVHDNGTQLDRAPRAVRYRIDGSAGVARLVGQLGDPEAPTSFCCGSSRLDSDGSWLTAWGGTSLVTEFDPRGRRTFRLDVPDGVIPYRAVAVPDGAVRIGDFRRAMNRIHGRP